MSGNETVKASALPSQYAQWPTIGQAQKLLGIKNAQYVRQLVLGGKLHAVKLNFGTFTRWHVDPAAIEAYKAKARSTVTGMRRYLVRVSVDKITMEQLAQAMSVAFGPNTVGDKEVWSVAPANTNKGKSKTKATRGDEEDGWEARLLEELGPGLDEDDDEDEDDALAAE